MAERLWYESYDFDEADLRAFRYVGFFEYGQCSLRNLVEKFNQFRSEREVADWIRNLPNTCGRQLLEVIKREQEITVTISLNGVELCRKYGYKGNCDKGCNRLHVCMYFLKGYCKREGKCPQSHDVYDKHNWDILRTYSLVDLNEDDIFMALRYMLKSNKRKIKTSYPHATQGVTSEDEPVKSLDELVKRWDDLDDELTDNNPHLNQNDQTDRQHDDDYHCEYDCATWFNTTSPSSSAGVNRGEVVHHLLSEHNGQCKYLDLIQKENLGFKNKTEVRNYFCLEKGQGVFKILEKPDGDLIVVDLKVEICVDYNNDLPCQSNDCTKLHICYLAVEEECENGNQCKHYHNFHNVHNKKVLKKLHLKDIRDQDILLYLKRKLQENLKEETVTENEQKLTGILRMDHQKDQKFTNDAFMSRNTSQCISRLTIIRFLLRQEGGVCSLKEFSSGTGFATEQAALDWINGSEGNTICKTYQPQDGRDTLVVTSVQHLGLCSDYQASPHGCSGCDLLHLCRDHLAGKCTRQPCKFTHSVFHRRNIAMIAKAGVDSLCKEEILLAIQYSLPRVCPEYNSTSGCRFVCPFVHICAQYVNYDCPYGNNCKRNHILTQCVLNLILQPSVKRKSQVARPPSIPGILGAQSAENIKYDVIQCLLRTPDGISSLSHIHQSVKSYFATPKELLTFLKSPVGRKICVVQNATLVLMKINRFQLCFGYASNKGCLDEKCMYLHLCTDYVKGNGHDVEDCKFSHNVSTRHNQKVIKRSGVDFLTQDDVITAIKHSLPKVCKKHNSESGCDDFPCGKFHLCIGYIKRRCPFPVCKKEHNFETPHNRELLSVLGYPANVAFKRLQQTLSPKKKKSRK